MSDTIKRNELLHFSQVAKREDVFVLEPEKRAELVESSLSSLYKMSNKKERDDLLSLMQTIMRDDAAISNHFADTAYAVCNRHLVITFVNEVFLKRSNVDIEEILGKSLYYEREYEGTQIEQLYSMVMETRMIADALVRYVMTSAGGRLYDGWFVLVVIPLEEGGIGVLSRFSKRREDIASEIDESLPDAPRYIVLNS